jgi:hypothetical protein
MIIIRLLVGELRNVTGLDRLLGRLSIVHGRQVLLQIHVELTLYE